MYLLKKIMILIGLIIIRYKKYSSTFECKNKTYIISNTLTPTLDYYIKQNFRHSENNILFFENIKISTIVSSVKKNDKINICLSRGIDFKTFIALLIISKKIHQAVIFIDDYIYKNNFRNKYYIKTAYRFYCAITACAFINTTICVSSPKVAECINVKRYICIQPKNLNYKKKSEFTYFYHGTFSHYDEIVWLSGIVKEVQVELTGAIFEVFGDNRIKKIFKGISGVRVVSPMSWADYFEYTRRCNYHVGLAPILDTQENNSRSYTKVFDITRCNAVGIYTNSDVYEIVKKNNIGILVDNIKKNWKDTIILLHNDRKFLAEIQKKAGNYIKQNETIEEK